MKRLLTVSLALGLAAPVVAQQTSSACPAGTTIGGVPDRSKATQDACQQAVDLFQYMVPQLGIAISGGNATLGQGGALGGLGHFTLGVRANVLQGSVPQVDKASPATSSNGAVRRTNYPTKNQFLGFPAVDASIGPVHRADFIAACICSVPVLCAATGLIMAHASAAPANSRRDPLLETTLLY